MIDRNANMAECSLSFSVLEDFYSRSARAGRKHLIFHIKMSFEGPSTEGRKKKAHPRLRLKHT